MDLLDLVGEPIMSFSNDEISFKRDMRATNTLNKLIGADFRAVYREERKYNTQWKAHRVDCSGETIYVLRKDNKVFSMSNSEWCSIALMEK